MLKKFLVIAAVVLGLVYGSGNDLASVKRAVLGAADNNARTMTGGSNDGWGDGARY